MSVFDHVYYPFHHDHINTPRKHPSVTPFELQMVGGVAWKLGGGITPLGGLDKSLVRQAVTWFNSLDSHNIDGNGQFNNSTRCKITTDVAASVSKSISECCQPLWVSRWLPHKSSRGSSGCRLVIINKLGIDHTRLAQCYLLINVKNLSV